jgi:hypothetical protein
MNRIGFAMLLIGISSGACATVPPPHERVATSEAAIRGAGEVGAEQVPQAALHLKLAQEAVQRAKALMKDGDNEAAGFVLLRAQADAELALALARENKTQMEARQVIERARSIGGGPTDVSKASPSPVAPAPNPQTPAQSPPAPAQNPLP